VVDPRIQTAIAELPPDSDVPARETIIASITKDEFLKFLLLYKQEKAQKQPGWSSLDSTYNVRIDNETKMQMMLAYHEQWADDMEPRASTRKRLPEIGGCSAW
jgi:hypothetical protein